MKISYFSHNRDLSVRRVGSLSLAALTAGSLSLGAAGFSPTHTVPSAAAQSSITAPQDFPYGSSKYLPTIGGNKPAITSKAAHLVSKRKLRVANQGNRNDVWEFKFYSAANDMVVTNRIITPKGTAPRPSLILLPGSHGKNSQRTWDKNADLPGFFKNKGVNVVTTLAGGYSFYSDWKKDDPHIEGHSNWETYIAKELPQVLKDEFHANDKMAIGGVSMSGSASLDIASRHPQTFVAAASYSGFPVTTSPLGRFFSVGIFTWGKTNPANAWGYLDNPAWKKHDPARNVHKMARNGTKVFVSSAGGVPGPLDKSYGLKAYADPMLAEFASDALTTEYTKRARKAGVDIYRFRRADGAHTFPVFENAMQKSWETTLRPALF